MSKHVFGLVTLLALVAPLAAQHGNGNGNGSGSGSSRGAGPAAEGAEAVEHEPARPQPSEAARAALAVAKDLAARVKGAEKDERLQALQAAAESYDRIAADFAAEPTVAAQAAYTAAELWRRHGSMSLAERAFLAAARLDPPRYGQRGQLGAADAQRRQERLDDALQSYAAAAAAEPGTARAQDARLWQGRVLQELGRLDDAIAQFRSALETATTPRQVLDTCNLLARAAIEQGDLDGAAAALAHADRAIANAIRGDASQAERLQKALDGMSARKALQRSRDKKTAAAKDAEQLK